MSPQLFLSAYSAIDPLHLEYCVQVESPSLLESSLPIRLMNGCVNFKSLEAILAGAPTCSWIFHWDIWMGNWLSNVPDGIFFSNLDRQLIVIEDTYKCSIILRPEPIYVSRYFPFDRLFLGTLYRTKWRFRPRWRFTKWGRLLVGLHLILVDSPSCFSSFIVRLALFYLYPLHRAVPLETVYVSLNIGARIFWINC